METSEAVNNSFHNFMFQCREQGKTQWIFPGDLKELDQFQSPSELILHRSLKLYYLSYSSIYKKFQALPLRLYVLTYLSSTATLANVRTLSQTLLCFTWHRTQVCGFLQYYSNINANQNKYNNDIRVICQQRNHIYILWKT